MCVRGIVPGENNERSCKCDLGALCQARTVIGHVSVFDVLFQARTVSGRISVC